MSTLADLAVSLARPVVRHLLPLERAEAAITVTCFRAAREGTLGGDGDPVTASDFWIGLLHQKVTQQAQAWDGAALAIDRQLDRMIERRHPLEALRAEAHNINADHGGLLTEDQVGEVVIEALYRHERFARARAARQRPSRVSR